MRKDQPRWRPMQRATLRPVTEQQIADIRTAAARQGMDDSREAAVRMLEDANNAGEIWINDLYQVMVHREDDGWVWLNIRRRDGKPILRDWRHFQRIKNELVGPECEAVELYPAESRLTDTSNKYHLFCCTDPTFRFPFGFTARAVLNSDSAQPGFRQRKLDADTQEGTA